MIVINYKAVIIGISLLLICIIVEKILKSMSKRDENKESFINELGDIESKYDNSEEKLEKKDEVVGNTLYDNIDDKDELIYNKEIESYNSFSLKVENQIRKQDVSFEKDEMFEWIKQIISSVILAKGKIDGFNKNIFTQQYSSKNVNVKELLGISNEIDKINISFITFDKYSIKNNIQLLNIILTINLIDMIDDLGNEKKPQYSEKTLDILLKRNLSIENSNDETKVLSLVCPVCGGAINKSENKCEYCGNIFVMNYQEWKIDNIEVN